MKRSLSILLVLISMAGLFSCEGRKVSKTPVISGRVTGLSSRVLYIMPDFNRSFVVDTLTMEEDKFAFNFVPDTTSFISLYFDQMTRKISLLVTPESEIQLEGSLDSLVVKNDSVNQVWIDFCKKVLPLQDSINAVQKEMRDAYRKDTMALYFERMYSNKRIESDSIWAAHVDEYVHANKNNPTALLAINEYITQTQNTDSIVSWMSALGPATAGFPLQKRLLEISVERGISHKGRILPFLTFSDKDGKNVKSDELKNGLLFLYLYAEEDNFSRAVKKDLMKLKAKLEKENKSKRKNKKIATKEKDSKEKTFSFWAISYANSEPEWRQDILQDSTKITNLYSKQGIVSDQLKQIGVGSLPTLLVINEKQEIISYNEYAGQLERTIKAYLAE
ncbi:MAG: DUF4369 domain-containing protein [Bacteroidales bacterium]